MGQQLSDGPSDLATLTFVAMALVGDTGFRDPSIIKFEVRRPSPSKDIAHLLCEH